MGIDVRNCRNCRRLFQYNGFGDILCPECRKIDDEEFDRVKKYLYANPGVSQRRLCEETGVAYDKIMQWLRQERLVTTDASGLGLKCEQCGEPINSGRLCSKCKSAIAKDFGLNRAPEVEEPKPIGESRKNQKMRFLHQNRES